MELTTGPNHASCTSAIFLALRLEIRKIYSDCFCISFEKKHIQQYSHQNVTKMAASKSVLERLEAVEKALAEAAKYNHPGDWDERARYWHCCGEENPRGMCWKIVNGHVCDITGSWPPHWDCCLQEGMHAVCSKELRDAHDARRASKGYGPFRRS